MSKSSNLEWYTYFAETLAEEGWPFRVQVVKEMVEEGWSARELDHYLDTVGLHSN